MIHLLHFIAAANATTPLQQTDINNLPMANADKNTLKIIMQVVFGIIGAFALLMITVSGLRYILSNGDPQKTATAKNGIIYSLIGVVIAISAEAIVGFVVGNL